MFSRSIWEQVARVANIIGANMDGLIIQKEAITQNGSNYLEIGNIKKLIYNEHFIFSGKRAYIINYILPLHSLHKYYKPLNISIPTCNVLVFLMSLMSLVHKSDISDMAFLLIIARWCVDNQRVLCVVQWVTWVFEPWKNEWNDSTVFRITINRLNFFQRKTWRLNIKTPSRFSNFSKFFFNNSKCFFNFSPDKLFVCLY